LSFIKRLLTRTGCEENQSCYPYPCDDEEGEDGIAKAHVAPFKPRSQISRESPAVDEEIDCVKEDYEEDGEEDWYVQEEYPEYEDEDFARALSDGARGVPATVGCDLAREASRL
jgi:hypothetical protein